MQKKKNLGGRRTESSKKPQKESEGIIRSRRKKEGHCSFAARGVPGKGGRKTDLGAGDIEGNIGKVLFSAETEEEAPAWI